MKLADYNEDDNYETVSFPCKWHVSFGRKMYGGKRFWRFDPIGLLFDPWNGLFRAHGWDMYLYPSYGTGFRDLWNNLCIRLTPWYRPRRRLLANLFNRNESKLLSSDRKSCEFRNRDADTRYFRVRFGFLRGTMEVVRYVSSDGNGENLFAQSLAGIASDGKSPVKSLHEERQVVIRRMPVLTMRQCERFMDAAVAGTKDWLHWW